MQSANRNQKRLSAHPAASQSPVSSGQAPVKTRNSPPSVLQRPPAERIREDPRASERIREDPRRPERIRDGPRGSETVREDPRRSETVREGPRRSETIRDGPRRMLARRVPKMPRAHFGCIFFGGRAWSTIIEGPRTKSTARAFLAFPSKSVVGNPSTDFDSFHPGVEIYPAPAAMEGRFLKIC